jgi:hypothetical protein
MKALAYNKSFIKHFLPIKFTYMTDITINIKTGSENSEPKVITTKDNTTTAVPKAESPKVETPKSEMK